MKQKLVLIGNGMAGIRTIEELLKLDESANYEITVFGEEPHTNYNRILLSPVLAGEQKFDDIILNPPEWYNDNGITLHSGDPVTEIDRIHNRVVTASGISMEYDRLIIATGSRPFMLPIPGADLDGVLGFRDIEDVEKMLEVANSHNKAVVIGGGLLGLEAANALMKQGMQVSVVHLINSLMENQLDMPAADLLKTSLEEKGLNFLLEKNTKEITGSNRVTGITFTDGEHLKADLVIMAVGIRPNIDLAKTSGIHCERGILVSDTMQTFDPSIYAVGECVQHRDVCYGLVAPLFEQAKVCANHLANLGYGLYEGSVTSTKLKVTGIELFSAGNFLGDDDSDDIIYRDPGAGVYKKLVIKDGRIDGAVLYGDTIDGAWYFQLMREGTDISSLRDNLLFGQAHLGDSGHGGEKQAMAMSDDAQVCDCNGVCKGDIIKAITTKGLFSLDEVKAHTKAAASCGSCTGLVEQILESTVGGDYSTPEHRPICQCSDFSHDQVRDAIRQQRLIDMASVFQALEWRNTDGCHTCRPAINYYLISTWPEEAKDDSQSRFVNERVHGNIQKDGSFSVIPRIWGGKTTPDELRAIADAAEKFNVGEVNITGGQRINMLGVQKEDLPAMWAFLNERGLVSGHAYGKALRTVKTCVGSTWCRFGTQDSTTLGIALEKMTWGSWMPHKFKMAVSGCPRNCAEATIKDFGVVAIDSGWELHIGGNGGVKVRATDMLCRVTSEEEVMEYCAAFIQIYREKARYLERTAPWVERVGLNYVKERILEDAEGRKALAERFYLSQRIAQFDPWAKLVQDAESHGFTPIKIIEAPIEDQREVAAS
ncbi:MAG: nitrite reductase large subunit NirB [Candidatus Thiodiazotropha taylori]|nr:nitrite reductase large subunit NirB [Candidatus Thiodiazotropha taylori]MCW4225134.1 nitrite reductase large subunit NirB [Candidatus Thiodiazotropha endolucinida]MCG8033295.1 nitrite reductase large subunit NirB [Candidatus Thiodiazotropha taylori]MCG8076967.1 nitrite reductase large subunit NirB [Candidatus Thiodiazotropha taylori]MCG8116213.1 nitrite reductase large subunit NirB [Candidatus Thiodiazotropha taylori]